MISSKTDVLGETWQICLGLFLVKCLYQCGWIQSEMGRCLTDDDIYLVTLAMHMRGVTSFNTHQVGERMTEAECLLQTREVGLAIRPTVALLNHSCVPNTVRCSAGRHVVIMASASIPAGQEVTDIYSQCYYDQDQVARAAKCQEYRFTCCCQACGEHWPLIHCLPGSLQDTPMSAIQPNIPRWVTIDCHSLS